MMALQIVKSSIQTNCSNLCKCLEKKLQSLFATAHSLNNITDLSEEKYKPLAMFHTKKTRKKETQVIANYHPVENKDRWPKISSLNVLVTPGD